MHHMAEVDQQVRGALKLERANLPILHPYHQMYTELTTPPQQGFIQLPRAVYLVQNVMRFIDHHIQRGELAPPAGALLPPPRDQAAHGVQRAPDALHVIACASHAAPRP
jgi:hypothetical protein